MPFFRKKRLFIILIGFIILVALIGFSLTDRGKLTTAEQFVNDTVGWAQGVIHAPVNFITDIFTNIDDFRDTYKENQLLKEELSENRSLIYESQELREENEELRNTLELTDSIRDFEPIQATVISRSPEIWMEQVTINKGEQDGVKPNMAVITAEGMVGKIQSPSQFTSTVQLITGFDQFNRISATISREDGKDINGMIEGFDKESNSLLFKIIEESDKDLEKGELVVSSGMGGVFPAGLMIGKVKEVTPDQYGLTRTALIEPAANMYEVNNVIVVDRTLTEEAEIESEDEEEGE
ncbi:rod shape-determining protein MreC [Virgibacillus profundi]|uniref:Cell shape-determining protein MreC n=1 Tax=Virgibacillus profundi TaxID=2024555 RepID=A0A2A2I7A2_9BACI|nr:rod shape-determining protein MreC [Virgibacillus profundi]PAV27619.1 rod shape-determining protein MreC [Virgibacillus profundi]PXY51797.1 rod shape-determining protein MreC [Virgibacillus profundi]